MPRLHMQDWEYCRYRTKSI